MDNSGRSILYFWCHFTFSNQTIQQSDKILARTSVDNPHKYIYSIKRNETIKLVLILEFLSIYLVTDHFFYFPTEINQQFLNDNFTYKNIYFDYSKSKKVNSKLIVAKKLLISIDIFFATSNTMLL